VQFRKEKRNGMMCNLSVAPLCCAALRCSVYSGTVFFSSCCLFEVGFWSVFRLLDSITVRSCRFSFDFDSIVEVFYVSSY
jgi:hypothetical protein